MVRTVGEQAVHQRDPPGRTRVSDERLHLAGRRQQPPQVKIQAARKCGVADQIRLGDVVLAKIGRNEAVDWRRPSLPDSVRQRRALERQRRFPFLASRGGSGRLARTLVDPRPDDVELAFRQRSLSERHRRRDFSGESLNDQADACVAGTNGRTAPSAVECVSI